MMTTSSAVLDKIQAGTLTALGRIFDKTAQLISGSLLHERAKFETEEAAPVKAAVSSDTEDDKDREKALEFVAEKPAKPAANEPEKPGKLSGFNQKILDEYQRQLATIKSTASTELRHAFARISTHQSRKLGSLPADSLQLVSYDEMELQIVLSHFENSLMNHFQAPLALLSMRFDHACKRDIALNQLPLSPVTLGHILSSAIQPLELDISDKKNLLMALLVAMKSIYRPLLEQINTLFIQNNILPELTDQDTAVRQKRDNQRKQADKKRKELLGLTDEKNSLSSTSEQLSQFIQKLAIPDDAQQHVIKGKTGAPVINRQELAAKVDLINEAPLTENNGVYRKLQTEQTLAQQLGSKAQLQQYGLSAQASNTISLMSMVFENLLANKNVPDAIKALLAQLQAPLLKAAIQDEMFLGDTDNPAQKLFNSITEASLSWSPETNPESDHLYKKMSAIVDKVSHDFDDDYLIFDEAIADFFTFRDDEEQKTAQVETRIVDRENAQARLHKARETADQHIRKKFSPLNLPDSVRQFLDTTWKQLLFFIYNKEHSKDAVAWQDAIEIENSLLINLSRKESEDVEVFLMVLEEKLQDCGIQLAEIQKQIGVIKEALATDHSAALAGLVIGEETDNEEENNRDAADNNLLQDVIVGSWLQKNDRNPPLKIKVAAHIKFNDSYVMVLRNGMKENTYTRQQLLEQIKNNTLQILKNNLLFESALENVISGIR